MPTSRTSKAKPAGRDRDAPAAEVDPFAPTPQVAHENGRPLGATPTARAGGQLSEAERTAARLRMRAQELSASHWVVHRCPRGHTIEAHRATLDDRAPLRCPICGGAAAREEPTKTAIREHLEWSAPVAALARAFETLHEWGARHLDAKSWTAISEMQRQSRTRGADADPFDRARPGRRG